MALPNEIIQDIRTHIKKILNKDVLIVDANGVCVTSYDQKDVGKKIDISLDKQGSGNIVKVGARKHVATALEYDNSVVGYALVNDTAAKTEGYLPLLKSFSELLIQQYYTNNQPVLDSTDQLVIKMLRHGKTTDYPFYESESTILGYDLKSTRIAIVIHLQDFWERCLSPSDQPSFEREEVISEWKKKINGVLNHFFTNNTDYIVAYIGEDKFVIFQAVEAKDKDRIVKLMIDSHASIFGGLKNFYIKDLSVGIGNPYSGVAGLIDSYREALLALEFGSRLWGEDKSYYFGNLGILSIIGEGNREKEVEFSHHLLDQLDNPSLIKTLECFFDQNLNLTTTSETMNIHRNTVIYRLSRIADILGVDPRVFDQAMTIKMALLIKKLFG